MSADQPEQLTLSSMPKRLFACTPSRLASFDCPRRYRMTYRDRPQLPRGAPWAHNTLGAVVHLALAQWWSRSPDRRSPEAAGELVERNWQPNGFRDDAQSATWRDRARTWVEQYLAKTVDPAVEPIGVERTVSVPVGALALTGRVDRIDDAGDELVVVDYKTGRAELTDDDARCSQPLALYVLATRRTLRRPCRRVELHHIPTGQVLGYRHTDESLARHLARAEATAHDIRAAIDTLASGAHVDDAFPPTPSPACSWCDFRQHCPEGRAASRPLDPWAGLAGEGR